MLLQPKKSKHKKVQKGKLPRLEFKANKLKFGTIGLKAAESGTISAKQIEAARQAIARKIKRKGKIWIRIFPTLPITSKPTGRSVVEQSYSNYAVLIEISLLRRSVPAVQNCLSKLKYSLKIFEN